MATVSLSDRAAIRRIAGRLLCAAAMSGPTTLVAQGADCLAPIQVAPAGELLLEIDGAATRLVFLDVEIADILFDGSETLSSAAVVTGDSPAGGAYQIWSLTAYPEGWVADFGNQICGEDLLDALDAQRLLAAEGDPLSGAMAALSPLQSVVGDLLRRGGDPGPDAGGIEAARAQLARFEDSLPGREGVFLLNLRPAATDPRDAAGIEARINAVLSDPTLAPDEMQRRLEEVMTGGGQPDDPALWTCPCAMEAVEAHLFGRDGPPYRALSTSWGAADARAAPFAATLTAISANPDGSYRIEGSFEGALFEMMPDPRPASGLSEGLGLPDMLQSEVATPVAGRFSIDRVLPGSLSVLPKLF